MSRLYYIVAATEAQGVKDCMDRGWERIAAKRFVTPDKDDVRVVCRISELVPLAGKTPMVKAKGYEDGPDNEFELKRWAGDADVGAVGEKAHFDRFIAEGHGVWIDL